MVSKFEDFEFSRSSMRLTRSGRPIRLTGQSLQLLVLLLDEPGRLVTREEIRTRLWPDTTVDFEHGLDVALNRLRAALGDSARRPVFVETVPRIGYRFIAEVRPETGVPPRTRARAVLARAGLFALTAILAALVALLVVHQHYDKFVQRPSHSAAVAATPRLTR